MRGEHWKRKKNMLSQYVPSFFMKRWQESHRYSVCECLLPTYSKVVEGQDCTSEVAYHRLLPHPSVWYIHIHIHVSNIIRTGILITGSALQPSSVISMRMTMTINIHIQWKDASHFSSSSSIDNFTCIIPRSSFPWWYPPIIIWSPPPPALGPATPPRSDVAYSMTDYLNWNEGGGIEENVVDDDTENTCFSLRLVKQVVWSSSTYLPAYLALPSWYRLEAYRLLESYSKVWEEEKLLYSDDAFKNDDIYFWPGVALFPSSATIRPPVSWMEERYESIGLVLVNVQR